MNTAYYLGEKTFDVRQSEPVEPGPEEVQIQVAYCGICGTDLHIYHGHMDKRVTIPHVIGHEMSGRIASTGSQVSEFTVGDPVVVRPVVSCGQCTACQTGLGHICQQLTFLGIDAMGALQEYWTVSAKLCHRLPAELNLKHGALVEPVAVACHDLRRSGLQSGEFVVVMGAGPIGMLIALLAQKKRAEVIITEVNEYRLALARQFNLDAIQPEEINLQDLVLDRTNGQGADIVFEVSGSLNSAELMTTCCRPRGRIVIVAIFSAPPPIDLFQVFWKELEIVGTRLYTAQDFEEAITVVNEGGLPLDQFVTAIEPMTHITQAFQELGRKQSLKTLINCQHSA